MVVSIPRQGNVARECSLHMKYEQTQTFMVEAMIESYDLTSHRILVRWHLMIKTAILLLDLIKDGLCERWVADKTAPTLANIASKMLQTA